MPNPPQGTPKNQPPVQQGGQRGQIVARHEQFEIHSGPLPHPDTIAGYERALPGSAERVFKMGEREQEHRHAKETREQHYRALSALVGQVFAFVIGISGTLGGVFLVYHDKALTGFSVFFVSLATLSGIYLVNRRRQIRNLPKNTPEPQRPA